MYFNHNNTMREQYKMLFKRLLQEQAGQLDPRLAETCAEVAWKSLGYHTSHMLDICQQANNNSPNKLAK